MLPCCFNSFLEMEMKIIKGLAMDTRKHALIINRKDDNG